MKNVKKLSENNTNYVLMKMDNFCGHCRKPCIHLNTSIIGKIKNIKKSYPAVNI